MLIQYIKLFIISNVFFLVYALGITWEESTAKSVDYYGGFFSLTFVIALLFFVALYGIYSYGKTKSIILPNAMLIFHLVFYWSWILCFTPRSTKTFDTDFLIKTSTRSLIFVGISVIFGLLTMLIMWVSKRKSQEKNINNENADEEKD